MLMASIVEIDISCQRSWCQKHYCEHSCREIGAQDGTDQRNLNMGSVAIWFPLNLGPEYPSPHELLLPQEEIYPF